MLGLEKLISKPVVKMIYNSKNDITMTKTVMAIYLLTHLISVGLMVWILYRLLFQKKKTTAGLVIPIAGLIVALFIPYNIGDEFIDMVMGAFSKVGTFAMFLAFIGLLLGLLSIVLYFVYKEEGNVETEA